MLKLCCKVFHTRKQNEAWYYTFEEVKSKLSALTFFFVHDHLSPNMSIKNHQAPSELKQIHQWCFPSGNQPQNICVILLNINSKYFCFSNSSNSELRLMRNRIIHSFHCFWILKWYCTKIKINIYSLLFRIHSYFNTTGILNEQVLSTCQNLNMNTAAFQTAIKCLHIQNFSVTILNHYSCCINNTSTFFFFLGIMLKHLLISL